MTSILKLPRNVLKKIGKLSNEEDILRIRTVCKATKGIVDDVINKRAHPAPNINSIEFWKTIHIDEFEIEHQRSCLYRTNCTKIFVRIALNKIDVDGITFSGRGSLRIDTCTVENMKFLVILKDIFDKLYFHMRIPDSIPIVSEFLEKSEIHSVGFYEVPHDITDKQRGYMMKIITQFKPNCECVQLYTAEGQIHMPFDLLKMAAKCGNMPCGAVETMISEDKISIKPCILIPFIVDILNGVCQYLDFSEILLITVEHVEQIVQKIASMDKKVHFSASVDSSLSDMMVQYGHLKVVIDEARFNRRRYKRFAVEHIDGEWHVHG